MEDFSRYWRIDRTLFLICCIVCMFLQTEGNSTSWMVGSRVTLHCSNNSISDLHQLTWTRNGTHLFSFKAQETSNNSSVTLSSNQTTIRSSAAAILNLSMSTLKSQLYALIIERAQKYHEGNYTCETTTGSGVFEQKWELIITENAEGESPFKIYIAAAVVVPSLCFLIFIFTAVIILIGVCKRRSQRIAQAPRRLQEQRQPTYENLDFKGRQQCGQIQVHPYKYRAE